MRGRTGCRDTGLVPTTGQDAFAVFSNEEPLGRQLGLKMAEHPNQQHPWWLEAGDEECPHCGQDYHFEVERRCAACDAPSCPQCVSEQDKLCPDCASESRP